MAKKYQSLIKWNEKDIQRLQKAVADFNQTVKDLEREQGKLGLPNEIKDLTSESDIKETIYTRNELNRRIENLREFDRKENQKITSFNGEVMTVWQKENLQKGKTQAIRKINKQIAKVSESTYGMGSEKLKTLKERKNAIQRFDKKIIEKYMRTDYNMKKAKVYMDNVKNQFDDLPKEFDEVINHLNKISNPLKFFDEMQKSDTLKEYFDWYKSPESFGSFGSDEAVAESIMEQLKLI